MKALTPLTPRLERGRPALTLAPMEGVTDAPMRALLSETGGFSFCVSEFVRVSQEAPPPRVFLARVPELASGGMTPAGLPVQVQLLGGDAGRVARAALNALKAGARAIDLNFGCPAPTVNRHDGGATLLKFPERIREIVRATRDAVPPEFPVSAKLRLGWDTMDAVHRNADMAAEGGAEWITIHGRTKEQGYTPPAYWGPIGEVRRRVGVPVVANGEIWTFDDFLRCRDQTGCEHFMLGRGALGDPSLAPRIARELGVEPCGAPTRPDARPGAEFGGQARDWLPVLTRFRELAAPHADGNESYVARRIKQWLRLAAVRRELPWLEPLKRAQTLEEMFSLLES